MKIMANMCRRSTICAKSWRRLDEALRSLEQMTSKLDAHLKDQYQNLKWPDGNLTARDVELWEWNGQPIAFDHHNAEQREREGSPSPLEHHEEWNWKTGRKTRTTNKEIRIRFWITQKCLKISIKVLKKPNSRSIKSFMMNYFSHSMHHSNFINLSMES